jgi:DNA-binding NarL/FixJ family response regulator
MLSDPELVVSALEAVLNERDIREFRHDQLEDRPFSNLSKTQIQVLRLIAEGKTNTQIAKERNRSLAATESLVTRTLKALDIEGNADLNVRVLAARTFLKNGSK